MLSWMEWNKKFTDSWCPACTCPNKKERRKLYDEYLKEYKMNNCNDVPCSTVSNVFPHEWTVCSGTTYSLGTVEVAQPAPCKKGFFGCKSDKKEEGNNPMNYATATVQAGTTETQDQRKYLSQRLEEIYWELLRPLEAKFGLTDDERPLTPKELKKRLEDGKFIIKGLPADGDDEEDEDDYFFGGSWQSMIRWRDPAKKSDADGYASAVKELQALRQKTLDTIKIDEPKSGLDAIKALEAWTPTGAAN